MYSDGSRLPGKYTRISAALERRSTIEAPDEGVGSIGLQPDDHQMQEVAQVYGLHPLAVEDAVHAHHRPKVERYDDTLFLVLKTVNYVPHESVELAREIVETGEIMVFVGRGLRGHRSARRPHRAGRVRHDLEAEHRPTGAGSVRGDARDRRPSSTPTAGSPRRWTPTSTRSRRC